MNILLDNESPFSLRSPQNKVKMQHNSSISHSFIFLYEDRMQPIILIPEKKKSFINLMLWFQCIPQQKGCGTPQTTPRNQMQCKLSCQTGIPSSLEGTLLQSQDNRLKQLRYALCINGEKSVDPCKLAGT